MQEIDRKICVVQFGGDAEVMVPYGTTILDAARRAGVFIDSLCGGDGVCGKCRVLVRQGHVIGGKTDFLTREEIRAGYILACEAQVAGDVVVEIPPETGLRGRITEVDVAERRISEIAYLQRQPGTLDPLVRKIPLKVRPATLEYNKSDLDRLEHALRQTCKGSGEYQMGLKVIRTLPETIRRANGQVTVTTAWRGSVTEITDVTAGDTGGHSLAVAVDVGTTSVVIHLIDVRSGHTLGTAAKYNSQAAYGADVIRRIIWCTEQPGGLAQLHTVLVEDVNHLIHDLLDKLRLSPQDIACVVAAGNTVMMHTLLAISPEWIRREPYSGAAYAPPALRAAEVGLTIHPRGLLYSLPSVSAFVGADITAGVLATGLAEMDEPRMLIDIGTNGEIVIGNKDWLVCASASAGPAFEGGGTRHGMRAMQGAIDHIRNWNGGGHFSYSVLGDHRPTGFCGTAFVDLLAEMLRMGVMDKTGRLALSTSSGSIRVGPDGTPEFVVVRAGEKGAEHDLVITQHDIANLVRTKGAIYSAAKVLLRSLNLSFPDLKEVMVAGAFGNFLDLENAVAIGLLPDLPADRLRFVGNTCVIGAKMAALSRARYEQVRRIADNMTYFELSTDPTFMEEFTAACFFPHTNIEEFPSVQLSGSGR